MAKQKITKSPKKIKIKIGDKFGRLEVLENTGIIKSHTCFKCKCKCGNIKNIRADRLKSGNTKSCGCLWKEAIIKANSTHGMYKSLEYASWLHMLNRCGNPKNDGYDGYGGRGITVCKRWLKFENFFEDMGIRKKGLSIERIDNNKGYYKENCKWATTLEQSRNKRPRKKNKVGVVGIGWDKQRCKYRVQIGVNGKNYFVGRFATLEQAKTARQESEQNYWK